MLDFISEIGALAPWLWRGWAFVFSRSYRASRQARWASKGLLYAAADITFSLAVMALEIIAVLFVAKSLLGALLGSA